MPAMRLLQKMNCFHFIEYLVFNYKSTSKYRSWDPFTRATNLMLKALKTEISFCNPTFFRAIYLADAFIIFSLLMSLLGLNLPRFIGVV